MTLSPSKLIGIARIYRRGAYVVVSNTDLSEGRGRSIILGYFDKFDDATACSMSKGLGGYQASIENRSDVLVVVPLTEGGDEDWTQAYVFQKHDPNANHDNDSNRFFLTYVDPAVRRKKALEKLTEEERELLGLSQLICRPSLTG